MKNKVHKYEGDKILSFLTLMCRTFKFFKSTLANRYFKIYFYYDYFGN